MDNKTYFLDINGDVWSYDMYGVREKISRPVDNMGLKEKKWLESMEKAAFNPKPWQGE